MRILLINAKPSLAESLAAVPGTAVALLSPPSTRPHPTGLHGVQVRRYSGGGKLSPRAAWQVRQAIAECQPDVVHAFYGRALAHLVLATTGMRGRPRIVSFRGIASPLSRFDAGDWLSYLHPLVDAHACESEAVRQTLIASGIDANHASVIYNCMAACPTCRPGRAALQQFNIPKDAFVVGTVATMRRVKGIDILLRAAADCADLRNVYWLLFGEVVDPHVRALAANRIIRERVRLAGHRADASELISAADIFVMPSRAEALCQALLEAMHQGVCPVVSDAGGMKEVVRHEREGLVFTSESVDALATAIRRLHANHAQVARYAGAARERIAAEFTPKKMAERCLAVYRGVLARGRVHQAA